MAAQKVLVVDDETHILNVVKSYLEVNGYTALTAQTGAEALGVIQKTPPDLILLDLMLPDITGEALCKTVRAASRCPIIMMTAKVDEASVIQGLKLGADDYVTKPFSPKQLIARVAAVLRRCAPESAGGPPREQAVTLRSGPLIVNPENRAATLGGAKVPFTKEEFEIVCLLMNNKEKIYTREEIIARVKNDGSDAFDRVVDAQIKNIRSKLRDDARNPRFIATVYGTGYQVAGTVEAHP
jgi:DNA-binding response OmpR family regulator